MENNSKFQIFTIMATNTIKCRTKNKQKITRKNTNWKKQIDREHYELRICQNNPNDTTKPDYYNQESNMLTKTFSWNPLIRRMWIEWLRTENGKLVMKRKLSDLIGAKMTDVFTNQFVNKALAILINTLGRVKD